MSVPFDPTDEKIRYLCGYLKSDVTIASYMGVPLSEVERVRGGPTVSAGPSHASFVIKALALALREFPQANRRI